MFGYIYKTTNLINGKIYIGQHHGDFNIHYHGSGNLIRTAINHTDLIIDLSKSIDPTITRDIKVRVWTPDLQSYTLKTIVDSGTTYTEALQTITACIGNGDSETFQKNVTKIAEDVFDEKNVWKVWEN